MWNKEHPTSLQSNPSPPNPHPPPKCMKLVGTQAKRHCIRFRMPKCLMPKATFIILNQLYVLLASADDGMSQLLWPSIIVGIVAVLVVVMIVIVMKQKWWMRANSQRNLEVCERNHYSFISTVNNNKYVQCTRLRMLVSLTQDSGARNGKFWEKELKTKTKHE